MFIFVVKKIRNIKNITLDNLSNKTNLPHFYLSKLENCSTEILEKIANTLEVNIKDLFYTTSDIQDLKQELNEIIDEHGLNSPEALDQSQLIDPLINLLNQ